MTIIMFYGLTRASCTSMYRLPCTKIFTNFKFYIVSTIVMHLSIREAVLDALDLNSEYFDGLESVLLFFFEICRNFNL